MTLDIKDILLASRATKFAGVLEQCEITGRGGAKLLLETGMEAAMQILSQVRKNCGSVYVIGNGGSAGVASHAVIDFVNVAKLRAFTLHESSLLTCMANDYGYENAYSRLLGHMAKPEDVLIAISSSGKSMNIRNAVTEMARNGGSVITLSGFFQDNPLRLLGDINIWLDSDDYGMVEVGHQFVLHNISDRFGLGYGI
ncbi:MAG: SIS domain-containing protein [Methylophilaceae bacterium]|nr:MAG: SIS domain-containing protein [Methylophilaceae bacterium]